MCRKEFLDILSGVDDKGFTAIILDASEVVHSFSQSTVSFMGFQPIV